MIISGESLIGRTSRRGAGRTFEAIEAATGTAFGPPFSCATRDELEEACRLAFESFDVYRNTALDVRADFLEAIAQKILVLTRAAVKACAALGLSAESGS